MKSRPTFANVRPSVRVWLTYIQISIPIFIHLKYYMNVYCVSTGDVRGVVGEVVGLRKYRKGGRGGSSRSMVYTIVPSNNKYQQTTKQRCPTPPNLPPPFSPNSPYYCEKFQRLGRETIQRNFE